MPLTECPPLKWVIYHPEVKEQRPSASHIEELCLFSAMGHTCVPCNLLSSTDVWVCLETLPSHPWPGTTAETIAVLHAVTCRDGFVNCLFTHQCLSQSMARCRTLTKCLLFKKNWGVLFLQVKQHKTRRMQVLSIPQTDFFFFFLVLEDIVTAETAEVLSCFQRAL